MRALGSAIVTIISGIFGVLSIPLFFLNMFGGIVSGIWLMVLGRWGEFGLGIIFLPVLSLSDLCSCQVLAFKPPPRFSCRKNGPLLVRFYCF